MIAHISLSVSDYQRAKKFYTKALKPLKYKQTMEFGEAAGFEEGGNTSFWITRTKKHSPTHVAFEAKNKRQVNAFYKEALSAGARDNGKPGYRTEYWPGYYAAFVYDMDGHNIEAVYFDHEKIKK